MVARKKKQKHPVLQRVLDDLARSGLADDINTLGIVPMTAQESKALGLTYDGNPVAADGYKIPYHGTDFFRYRLLNQKKGFGVTLPKYLQPGGSEVKAYFSPLLRDPWDIVRRDRRIAVRFTEGEKKGSACCKLGLPCIGLGGVYSFASKKRGVKFLPELSEFIWDDREVYILFDSDYYENPDVKLAHDKLLVTLEGLGARVYPAAMQEVA